MTIRNAGYRPNRPRYWLSVTFSLEFEWDAAKARRNLATHVVDFEDAKRAVLDPFFTHDQA